MAQLDKPAYFVLDGHQGHDVLSSWKVESINGLEFTKSAMYLAPLPPTPQPLNDPAGTFGGLTNAAGVAVAPDGTVYVADANSSTLYKISCHADQPLRAHYYTVGKDPYTQDRFVFIPALTRVERWPAKIRGIPDSNTSIENICLTAWTESVARKVIVAYINGSNADILTELQDDYPVGLASSGPCQNTVSWLPCIGGLGWEPGRFNHPHGLAISRHGELYVADTGNHRIQIFLDYGKAIAEVWGKNAGFADLLAPPPGINCLPPDEIATHYDQPIAGSQPGEFNSPSDVALCDEGSVFIADTGNHRVQKRCARTGRFSTFDGTQLAAHIFLVLYGPKAGDRFVYIPFSHRLEIWPASLGRDPQIPSETIVVSLATISVAMAKAEALSRLAPTGSNDILQEMEAAYPITLGMGVPFSRPFRLAIDNYERIYVVDLDRDSVAVLNAAGRLLADITYATDASGAFRPSAVSLDAAGNLVVATSSALLRYILSEELCSYAGCCATLLHPCIALDCTQERAVLCSSNAPCPVSILPSSSAYLKSGQCIVAALDSRIDRCKWDKVRIEFAVPIPTGCTVQVSTYTSETILDAGALASLTDDDWDTNQTVSNTCSLSLSVTAKSSCIPSTASTTSPCGDPRRTDFLILSPRGRYLWLRIKLTSDTKSTPVIKRFEVFFPRIGYLQYLPAIYQADPVSADFLDRFLANFETTLSAMENRIDHLAALFSPFGVPAKFLTWLAGWLDLVFQPGWSERTRRLLLQNAASLYKQRGTLAGLKRFIQLALGVDVQILEWFQMRRWLFLNKTGSNLGDSQVWGNCIVKRLQLDENSRIGDFLLVGTNDPERDPFHVEAYKFSVFVPAALAETAAAQSMLRLLLESEKPAHTQYDLMSVEAHFRLGVQSTIGFDTLVGAYPRTVLCNCSTLGFDSLLSCTCEEQGMAVPLRLDSVGIQLRA